MYLKSIEINGFKSFATKTTLNFNTQISGIVGPNGSGKSNVAEAFRFVLGEQSLKNMRSKKGEDLIFAGPGSRLNRGGVKVVFDNSKKQLPVDYSEVVVERVVTRDGVNEYLINKGKVRAKDVAELLASANVGSTGHHIISQGEADKMLLQSPKERKLVIEDALGLKVFTIKKNEAERKLTKTKENVKEVRLQKRATTPKLNMLRKEVEKLERSKSLREELRELYRAYFPAMKGFVVKQQETQTVLSASHSALGDVKVRLTEARRRIEEFSNSNQTVEENTGPTAVELRGQLQSEQRKAQELRNTLAHAKAKLDVEKAEIERAEQKQAQYGSIREKISTVVASWAATLYGGEAKVTSAQKVAEEVLAECGVYAPGTQQGNTNESLVVLTETINKATEEMVTVEGNLAKLELMLEETRMKESGSAPTDKDLQIHRLELEKEHSVLLAKCQELEHEKKQIEEKLERFGSEEVHARTLFGVELDEFKGGEISSELNVDEKMLKTRILLENIEGVVSENVAEEYKQLEKHHTFLEKELVDLEQTQISLEELLTEVTEQVEERFRTGLEKINNQFGEFFSTLFSGGNAKLSLVDMPTLKNEEGEVLESELGVDIAVNLPNKKVSSLSMLSGGERSLSSIALLFAMSQVTPPPFIILDETDAALDEANSKRYGDMIELLAKNSQLIVITHNRETMSRAGVLYGVTMGNDGQSRLLSVSLDEAEAVAK